MKAIAAAHQITTGAASMRLVRIKKVLESATEPDTTDNNGGKSTGGGISQSPHTPKSKSLKADPVGILNTNGNIDPISTPSPEAKGKRKTKKRKLIEEEQADALIQRAGMEVLKTDGEDPPIPIKME